MLCNRTGAGRAAATWGSRMEKEGGSTTRTTSTRHGAAVGKVAAAGGSKIEGAEMEAQEHAIHSTQVAVLGRSKAITP